MSPEPHRHFAQRAILAGALAGALLSMMLASAVAQDYPAKPVRVISPYPPGSSADIIGRIYSPKLTDALGKQFVVDNRSGASGNIAAEIVARAAPDGYTLLLLNTAIIASQPLYKSLPFDLSRDFQAVAMLGLAAYVLAVNVTVPVKSVGELVALAKAREARGNKMIYASTGIGGGLHLTMELFKLQTGTQMLHVPYKGTSTAVPDLIGGQIETMFGSAPALSPHVRSSRIRALGISSLKRSGALPDIPTIAESGVPGLVGFESVSVTTLATPTGTPRGVITRLNATINKSAQSPDTIAALAHQSTEPAPMTPEQTTAYIRDEMVKWKKVIAIAGVKSE